ncbi:MAG: PDZ domain-containing protein [Oligoflexales bacterium]
MLRPNIIISALIIVWTAIAFAQGQSNVKMSSGNDVGVLIMGSIAHTDAAQTVVLIKEAKTGKVRAVKKGFLVAGEFKVLEATAKYLMLEKKTGEKHLVYQSSFAGEFKGNSMPTTASSDLDYYSEDGFERKAGKIRMTASYKDNMINNDLSKILMQASAIPHYVDGQIKGFQLLQIDKGSIFDNAGFKDNDVIISINGSVLNNVSATIKLLHSLKAENHIEVEFDRGGQISTTSVEVN